MLPALTSAAFAGGFSLLSGFGAQRSAKKAEKRARIEAEIAEDNNQAELNKVNEYAERLGMDLHNIPLVVQRWRTGGGSRTATRGFVDVDGMMKAAEAAGFNPRSFLDAGGLAAYAGTYTELERDDEYEEERTTGHNAVAAQQMRMYTPFQHVAAPVHQIPDTLQVLGDAGSAAFKAGYAEFNQSRSNDLAKEMLATNLNAIQKSASTRGRSFFVPGMTEAGSALSAGLGAGLSRRAPTANTSSGGGGGALKWPAGWSGPTEKGDAKVTNPWGRFQVDPSSKDAAAMEERYGEPGDWAGGVMNAIGDAMYYVTGKTARERAAVTDKNLAGLSKWWGGLKPLVTNGRLYSLPGYRGSTYWPHNFGWGTGRTGEDTSRGQF